MCGRYTLHYTWREIYEQLQGFLDDMENPQLNVRPRYNIAPSQDVLSVVRDGDQPAFKTVSWGFVPFWKKDKKGPYPINARIETVASSGMFRGALKAHRCLVIADGYYEWVVAEDGKKQPYRLIIGEAPQGELFAFAGLWAHNETLETQSCTIITGPAAEQISYIHNRMPIILRREDYKAWLSADNDTPMQALTHDRGNELHGYKVSRAVNSSRSDEPAYIEPSD